MSSTQYIYNIQFRVCHIFQNSRYQGILKATVSGVFEDLKGPSIYIRRQYVLGGEGCPHVPMVKRSQYIRIKNPLHKHFAGMPMVGGQGSKIMKICRRLKWMVPQAKNPNLFVHFLEGSKILSKLTGLQSRSYFGNAMTFTYECIHYV